jgi:hypothetical protein
MYVESEEAVRDAAELLHRDPVELLHRDDRTPGR